MLTFKNSRGCPQHPSQAPHSKYTNNHSITVMDINIQINKWDTAESTSRAGIAYVLSLHQRYLFYFLGKVFCKSNILTK